MWLRSEHGVRQKIRQIGSDDYKEVDMAKIHPQNQFTGILLQLIF